jgi:anti-sigma factor ChrR (cupin superfamily)
MDLIINSKNYRITLKEMVDTSFNEMSTAISRLLDKSTKPINAKDLDSFPLGRWEKLGDNIKAKKKRNRFLSYLSFDIKMEAGARFAEHFHSDVIESTEVIEGEMLDTTTGILYVKGDVAHWDKDEKHTPVALKYTKLHVLFKRTKA